jgi:hypothetical protein
MAVLFIVAGSERARLEPQSSGPQSIVVTTTAELVAALSADPGGVIFVQRGTYLLAHAIEVPDQTALIGEGAMLYDDSGLPLGFAPESRTVIAAMPGVTGDFVTLGDGASLQGLIIQDVVRPTVTGGAVVMVPSRAPDDFVSAHIVECDIVNPNPLGRAPGGPTGRGVVAMTANPQLTSGAAPHEQSVVSLSLTQSIIRSPAGGIGVFGVNFAALSHIELHLKRNVIGGGLDAVGGASRPDSVVGATTLIHSNGNLYRPDSATHSTAGWNLAGGADAPFPGIVAGETLNNTLLVHSVDDRIEGFVRAISALGGQRASAQAGASSSNHLELVLEGSHLASTASDLLLYGARSNIAAMPVGDNNDLRVTMRGVIGSGSRTNEYADALPNLGIGNRLVINGNLTAFSRTNEAILPRPGEQFFSGTWSDIHSSRKATTGLMRAARRAGQKHAWRPTASSTKETPAKVRASNVEARQT